MICAVVCLENHTSIQQPGGCELSQEKKAKFKQVWINPLDPNNMIAADSDDQKFVTLNCGTTFHKLIGQAAWLYNFKFNHFDPNLILAKNRITCRKHEADCIEYNSLYLSTNKGRSWIVIRSFIYDYAW